MYREKFVLSVIHDGRPVRESGGRGNRQVAIPFGSEYKLRLKNKNDRSCTANITIDGTPVSNLGDIIVNAGGTIDLERFITGSLSSGKRFKFVSLDHPDVDDPTKSENGVVRVEFRLAKQSNGIKIKSNQWEPAPWPPTPPFPSYDGNTWSYFPIKTTWASGSSDNTSGVSYQNSSGKMKSSVGNGAAVYCASISDTASCAAIEAGATIEGGHSGQSFSYSNLEVESHATVLELKIVGIRKNLRSVAQQYCTSCGHCRIRKTDKYCGGCGRRI